MDLLYISILLGLLPIISYVFQRYFSKRDKLLNEFKNHGMVSYSDWLFIPFNFVWIYAVSINLTIFITLLLIAIIANVWLHFDYWLKAHLKENKKTHMYYLSKKRLSSAGKVHLAFSIIQTILIFSLIISPINSFLGYLEMAILGLFFISYIPSSIKIHGKILPSDGITAFAGVIVVLVKVLFF